MKRKYSQAAHAKRRLQDAYIDGITDDEQAEEAWDWHDEYTPPYEASQNHHVDEHKLPF